MCEVSDRIMERGRKIGEEQGIKIGEAQGRKIGEARGRKIGEARGRKIGEAQGRKIGSEKKAQSTALNLSRMGLTPEQIAGAVDESLEQVKNWLAGVKPAN